MSTNIYFVYANPAVSEAIASFLAAQGEVSASETKILKVDGRQYPCWAIRGTDVKFVKQYVHDNPDVVTDVRLFERREGQGKNAHDVSFMLGKSRYIRDTVLKTVATRGRRGESPSRAKILKPAK